MNRLSYLPAIVAVVFAAGCTEGPSAVLEPTDALHSGGGNPHWQTNQTGCELHVPSVSARCKLKAVGLGGGGTNPPHLSVTIDIDGDVAVSCYHPNAGSVPGWTGRTRVGSGSGEYDADRNGQVTAAWNLTGARYLAPVAIGFQGNASLCPGNVNVPIHAQWQVSSVISNLSYEMRGEIHRSNGTDGWVNPNPLIGTLPNP
jgi:hypothetical protein